MEIAIRRWELRDYQGIADLFLQLHQLHQRNRPDFYVDTGTPFPREAFEKIIGDENNVALLAETDGKIIGFTLVTLKKPHQSPLLHPRKVAYMEDLVTHEDYRRLGVGNMLFEAAKEKACDAGCDKLELMVWSFNDTAVRFYKSKGMAQRSVILEADL